MPDSFNFNRWTFFLLLGLILIAGGFLLFKNLGNRYLWQDECSVALVARSLLKNGIPLAWDGRNMVECWNGNAFNDKLVWNLHPWLPNYLIASSFACLGESAFSARLPFAIAGWFSILLLFFWTIEMTKNKEIALMASLIMTCSVPFILFSRQCNYYALLVFLSIPIYYGYFFLNKKNMIIFSIFSAFLFHANYFSFAVLQISLLCHFFLLDFNIIKLKRLIWAYIIIILSTLPWWIAVEGYKNAFFYLLESKSDIHNLFLNIARYLTRINDYFFPVLFIFLAAILFYKKEKFRNVVIFLLSVLVCGFIAFPSVTRFPIRYSIGLIPIFSLFSALVIYRIKARYPKLGYLILIIYITTNLFGEIIALPTKAVVRRILPDISSSYKKDLADIFTDKPLLPLIKELTTDYDCPNEGIVKFLGKNAQTDQYILATYGQNVLAFYTDLKISYVVLSQNVFDRYHAPKLKDRFPSYVFSYENVDWFIPRKGWDLGECHDKQFFLDYFEKRGLRYKKYVLDYPDVRWNNRPELEYHYFVTPQTEDRVEIYRIFK